jgi:hypothetical protein
MVEVLLTGGNRPQAVLGDSPKQSISYFLSGLEVSREVEVIHSNVRLEMERGPRLELKTSTWEGCALPLSYPRTKPILGEC